ncbi:MAG: DUF4097 family beta strand repeat-containing protein [Thermoanaerobaculia bacterium]
MNRLAPAIFAAVATVFSTTGFAGDCAHSGIRDVSMSARGVRKVHVVGSAGTLRVAGRHGATEVRARGKACAPSTRILGKVQLIARRVGDEILIQAKLPSTGMHFSFWTSPSLDFVVDLPATIPVEIEDGSGDMQVIRVASVDVEDGSGEIDIYEVGGDVQLLDGSGDVTIRDVRGNVTFSDGSGDVIVRRTTGDVDVECDGSGDLEFVNIGGSVEIESDGSGSIEADGVGGAFTVSNDGSGGIHFARVRGRVRIPTAK